MKVDDIMSKIDKKIISISIVALLVIVSVGVSFAFFTANMSGGESASTITLKAGTLDIAFAGGDTLIFNNIYPKTEAWGTKTFTVKGNNTTDLRMPYSLSLIIDYNEFTSNVIQYGLHSVNTGNNGEVVPSTVANVGIATGASTISLGTDGYFLKGTDVIHTYQLSIYFPDTGISQNEEQEKKIGAHIGITAGEATS